MTRNFVRNDGIQGHLVSSPSQFFHIMAQSTGSTPRTAKGGRFQQPPITSANTSPCVESRLAAEPALSDFVNLESLQRTTVSSCPVASLVAATGEFAQVGGQLALKAATQSVPPLGHHALSVFTGFAENAEK